MRSYRLIQKTLRIVCLVLIRIVSIVPLVTLSFLGANSPVSVVAAPLATSRASPVTNHIQPQSLVTRSVVAPQDASDPYGDTASYSGVLCSGTADNGIGAPDGTIATLTGLGCSLTISFDPGQPRTGNLAIYSQNLLVLGVFSALDIMSGTEVLQTIPNAIDLTLIGAQTSTILYTGTVPYTGIRLSSLLVTNYGIDAVQELPDPPLPADPYADAGQVSGTTCPALLGSSANAATGAPDGVLATLGVGLDCTLLLDLGNEEEGLGALTIYYTGTAHIGAGVTVSLLDANGNVLTSTNNLLDLSLTPGALTTTLGYTGTVPYRYVAFSNLVNIGVLSAGIVDAVQAQYYNGSDSDGDGVITNCPTPGLNEECAGDSDSDGIPDYLDNDSLDNAQTQKLVSHTRIHPGDTVTYEIALHNSGVVTLTPTITDDVPSPLHIVTAVPSGTQTSNTLVWSGVIVPPSSSVTLTLVAMAPLSTTTLYTVTNHFVGSLPAEFSFNQIPERTSPVLTVAPYIYYMPIVMTAPTG